MRGLKKRRIYKGDGLSNIKHLKGKSGVYFISNRVGDVVYIGHSKTNLYKTIHRHFQQWNDPQQQRKVYSSKAPYSVKVYLANASDAYVLERDMILKYRPRDNKLKIKAALETRRNEVLRRFSKSKICKDCDVNDFQKFSYNESGEVIDENGNVIF
jgi:hypothetical protein